MTETLKDTTPKPLKADGDGAEALKPAILALLNDYPALHGREIVYQGLTEDSGISVEPESGALVYNEQKDIVGGVHQSCQFPFYLVYRAATNTEYQKLRATEFLDNLGAWICREPVSIDGEEVQLAEYPDISGNRRITAITRFNSYPQVPNDNNTQDWVLPITVNYTHDFYL